MIGGDNFVAAVDVGATKTAAVLLGLPNVWDGGGELPEVLGSGLVPTEGVRNQAVTNHNHDLVHEFLEPLPLSRQNNAGSGHAVRNLTNLVTAVTDVLLIEIRQ